MKSRFTYSPPRQIVHAIVTILLALLTRAAQPVPAQQPGPCEPPNGNPVVCENQLSGSPAGEWELAGNSDPEIQGFTTDFSVDQGQTVSFKIKSTTAYHLDIYRMGFYGGMGARKVATIATSATTFPVQPACLTDTSAGLVDCGNWTVTATWSVPATAVSGIYFAKATRSGGGSSHIFFIVRDDDGRSDVLFQTSDTTWQAYNRYGGNSLYVGPPPAGRAYKVSYNRPFTTRETSPEDWVFHSEYPMVRWLEANGYHVSYTTGVDSDRRGAEITEHRIFLSVGHDEYWSATQRASVEAARNAGVNLAFLSGNEVFWKTRWENSIAPGAASHRTLVSYKETHANAKIDPVANTWTGTWRDPRFSPPADGGRPENALTGTFFMVNAGTTGIRVPAAEGRMRFWRNTNVATLAPGAFDDMPNGTLGYEWDEDADNGSRPPGLIRLSDTTVTGVDYLQDYGSSYAPGTANHALTLYRHASGALVFGAGTVQWSWGLDAVHDGTPTPTKLAMQQATVNLFADMGVQPRTPAADIVPASASVDALAPASIITSPASGATVAADTTVTVTGTATDAGGGAVGGVEVSIDGGTTWRRATGRGNWTFNWQTGAAGTVTLRSRAVDDSGNLEQPGAGTTVTVGAVAPSCPCSLWGPTITPGVVTQNDGAALELGTRFQSDVSGYITAIRFYKSAQNTGPFIVTLWTATGSSLASVPYTSTTSGWQQVSLPTPVAIAANVAHVVSYHTASGFYSANGAYFATTGVDNGPLHAPRDTASTPNGLYRYGGASGFPTQTFNSTNYWVDVVFVTQIAADTTPPQVTAVSPAENSSAVSVTSAVTATFSEDVNPATVTSSSFQLRTPTGTVVNAAVSYAAATRTASLQPATALSNSTTYTATVRGGSTGIKDGAGNAMAADKVWSFTTAAPPQPPPNEGPGGPILIVSSAANPFSRYYTEILRNEGFNAFLATDISNVTSTLLGSYDVVLLGEMPLTSAHVTMFSNWVTSGGNLIAMRPDKQLAALLGVTDGAATLPEGYLLVNTSQAPGAGIYGQTMQFHGIADRYTLSGATAIALLYSDRTTATADPAITIRTVGGSGGQAVGFTYDLARSVIYTRQGNPAWSGQDRDSNAPIRSNDLFFGGGTQPDWVDRERIAVPQADEQQRLLANLINFMNADRKPLPRFWYLPRGLRAAIVMTGDDHANNGTAGRFDIYQSNSAAGCSVANWECIRATSYIYANSAMTPAQVQSYIGNGFEIAVHVNTDCANYSQQSLNNTYTADLASFATKYPSAPAPRTNRTHCVVWSDFTSQANVALSKGIRLDTNYYYYPGTWVNDTPGLFTGSGMPMRFARADGSVIDVYQATTQMTDESSQSYPLHVNALLDGALGPRGYYGVFAANMHTDIAVHPGSSAIVAAAQARNVPVISSRQLLDWLDGRNGSTFGGLSWSTNTLSFTVSAGAGANGLQAMVPATSSAGLITGVRRNGTVIAYETQTIKGVSYAIVSATAGNYTVQYGVDATPPIISGVTATPSSTSAVVAWTTNEPSTSVVNYGLSASSLTSSASVAGLVTNHTVPLTGLSPGTPYFYRVTSADAAGNSASAPATAASFTTPAGTPTTVTITDTTISDFAAGTATGAYVSATANGELTLVPTVGAEFTNTGLPAGWTSAIWNTGGAVTAGGGTMNVDGARAHTAALFTPGSSVEFVATFGVAASQHAGLGVTLNETPWAIFSTGSGGALYARTHTGATPTDTLLSGNWLSAPHRFRIDWTASAVTFYIDGTQVATHPVAITGQMRPIASDFNAGGGGIAVDWIRMSPYGSSGTFVSRVLDGGAVTQWASAAWTSVTPTGTTVAISARFGNTATPDGTWTPFQSLAPGASLSQSSRYVQYRAVMTTANVSVSPALNDMSFTSAPTGGSQPSISIADVSVAEGNAGSANAVFTLMLSGASTSTVSVTYATANGTATAGSDYTAASGTASFAPGATSATFTVPVTGDTVSEPNETVLANLNAPVNATIADTQGVLTITNDDGAAGPQLTIGNAAITEGNTGTATALFTVTLSAASTSAVTVAYTTADGTASAGADYTATAGTLTFPAGTTSQTISVPVLADLLDEANETFTVTLSSPANATLGSPSQGAGTIVDDDESIPTVSINDVTISEGHRGTKNVTFTVQLSAASSTTVTVAYATANGTALAGSDYVAESGTLTLPPGTVTRTVTIAIVGDRVAESIETFVVNISNATNAAIVDAQGACTITDND